MGTGTLSSLLSNSTLSGVPTYRLPHLVALQMEEGTLTVEIEGYEPATAIDGDVVFVLKDTDFKYYGKGRLAKFLYVTGGYGGLDSILLAESQPWDSKRWLVR